jgi:hypothetical protein
VEALGSVESSHETKSRGRWKLDKWLDRLMMRYNVVACKGVPGVRLRAGDGGISKGDRFSDEDVDGDPAAKSFLNSIYVDDEDNPL